LLQLQKASPSQDDVAAIGGRVDERVASILVAQANLATGVDELASQVEQLQNKLEDTNFRLAQLSQQIAATQKDLQAFRLAAEEAQRAGPPSPPSEDPGNPQALYETAYNDYVAGNFDLAILGFRQYLESFPETDQSDNAAYWLGECYYRQSRFKKAVEQFDLVLDRYQTSDRAASALLKKGYAYLELNQRAQGVVQLQKVICEHAGTDEAVLARNRLLELGIDVEC
jgi:tol-pal system protein YbgF